MTDLHTAIARLRQFRATFNEGEPVDEESGLTADDLTAIITHFDGMVQIPSFDLNNPVHVAELDRMAHER